MSWYTQEEKDANKKHEQLIKSRKIHAFENTHTKRLIKLGCKVENGVWSKSYKITFLNKKTNQLESYTYCPIKQSLYEHRSKQWFNSFSLKLLFYNIQYNTR